MESNFHFTQQGVRKVEIKYFRQRFLQGNKKLQIIAAIVLIAAIGVAFYQYQAKSTVQSQRPAALNPAVDVVTITRKDMKKKIDLTGQTIPESQVDISAKYAGKITEINVKLGDRVTTGQILIVQDTKDVDISLKQTTASLRQADADAIESNASFEANYQKAQAAYQQSVTNYERYDELYKQGAVPRQALDDMRQQMIAAQSTVDAWAKQLMGGTAASVESKRAAREKASHSIDALENQRNDLMLRSPRDGVIGYRQAEVGAMVSAGQKLLSIVDNSSIYIDCAISEQDIGHLAPSMPVNITLESLGKTYEGKVIYISPAMDPKSQTFTIRITLDHPDDSIRAGMFARTSLEVLLRPQTFFVPKDAVISTNGIDRIFVIDSNGKVMERTVKLGLRNDTGIEILSGINEGEQVALTNLSRLKNGMTVTAAAVSGS